MLVFEGNKRLFSNKKKKINNLKRVVFLNFTFKEIRQFSALRFLKCNTVTNRKNIKEVDKKEAFGFFTFYDSLLYSKYSVNTLKHVNTKLTEV